MKNKESDKKLKEIIKVFEQLDKLKSIPCKMCKGSGYSKLGDWRGHYAVTCSHCCPHHGLIPVDGDFRWKELKKIIKKLKEENEK